MGDWTDTPRQREYLPGHPKPKLVKEVRSHLSRYGIRPTNHELWQLTWKWACDIAVSYFYTSWPMASEIAAQYVLLLLSEMRTAKALRLPYRASDKMPGEVRSRIHAANQITDGRRKKASVPMLTHEEPAA